MNRITTGKKSASKSGFKSLWAGLARLLQGGSAGAAPAGRRCLASARILAAALADWLAGRAAAREFWEGHVHWLPALDRPESWFWAVVVLVLARSRWHG